MCVCVCTYVRWSERDDCATIMISSINDDGRENHHFFSWHLSQIAQFDRVWCVCVCCGVLAVGTPGFITGVVPNIYMGGIVRRVLCVWAMRVFLGVPVGGRTDLS